MSHRRLFFIAAACAFVAVTMSGPASTKQPPQAKGDPREAVALAPAETEILLAGMRTYLESIQGILAAMAENQVARVPDIAAKSGNKLLQNASPLTGFKLPIGFTSMSFNTHERFDILAEKARRGAPRAEVLRDLRDIMANCISCHASYRLAP